MTELSFPSVSVSSSGDEYFQVCFQEADDSDEAYLLIQRQFEDDDGGYLYVECPHEPLGGHFILACFVQSGTIANHLAGRVRGNSCRPEH